MVGIGCRSDRGVARRVLFARGTTSSTYEFVRLGLQTVVTGLVCAVLALWLSVLVIGS